MKTKPTPKAQLDAFIDKFTPEIGRQTNQILARMQRLLPGAHMLVYDNYNALAIGFGTNDKLAGMIFSVAVFPRWVSLFFANGPKLKDPKKLLKGSGTRVRHIVLTAPEMLDDPDVRALMKQAIALAHPHLATKGGTMIIKSISAKQRPRRPG